MRHDAKHKEPDFPTCVFGSQTKEGICISDRAGERAGGIGGWKRERERESEKNKTSKQKNPEE